MQLTGRDMTESQSRQVSIFLHTISDFERLGDHAVNLSKSANELYEKKISVSDEATYELSVLGGAVRFLRLQSTPSRRMMSIWQSMWNRCAS